MHRKAFQQYLYHQKLVNLSFCSFENCVLDEWDRGGSWETRTSNSVHRPPLHQRNLTYVTHMHTHKVATPPPLKLKGKTKFKSKLYYIFYVTHRQAESQSKLSQSFKLFTQHQTILWESFVYEQNMCSATPAQSKIVTNNIILHWSFILSFVPPDFQ